MKRNSVLLTILALSVALLVLWIDVVAAGSSGYLTRVTASDNDRASFEPSLSAGGTVVAFTSDSDFLGQGIPDN
jgi:hypothetical protein